MTYSSGTTTKIKRIAKMAKYYVESGQVRVVFDAEDATAAAVRAFQWSCDKQAGIEAESPLDDVFDEEQLGWQLDAEIRVSELGFGRDDAQVLDTLDVVAIWQGGLFPWVG
jgi:hypothetical protein